MLNQGVKTFLKNNDRKDTFDEQVALWLEEEPTVVIDSIALSGGDEWDMLAVLYRVEPETK